MRQTTIRRRDTVARRDREEPHPLLGVLLLALVLAAFAMAGTMDYHDDQAALEYWAKRGITIQRW